MPIPSSNTIVGQNIRLFREKLNLTQEALAKYLDTSREQISYYETGARAVSSKHLTLLSNLFCLNEYDFFEENTGARSLNIAFAFRAEELSSTDLESIARFKTIVRNYLNMQKALANE